MKTLGEKRVRTEFNPSSTSEVDDIKQKTAEIINLLEDNLPSLDLSSESSIGRGETIRLFRIAQTEFEQAAMWAVKAFTSKL